MKYNKIANKREKLYIKYINFKQKKVSLTSTRFSEQLTKMKENKLGLNWAKLSSNWN